MTDFEGWFDYNNKRPFWCHFIQFFACRKGHDEIRNYLNTASGKRSEYYNRGVCKRCKHLQLYRIPSFIWEKLEKQ